MSARIRCQGVWKRYLNREALELKRVFTGASIRPAADKEVGRWALQDVSFELAPGESFGIMGPNGSGKSTLLSLLIGSLRPDRGEIEMEGRRLGLLDLGGGLHPELNGRENIFLYGTGLGMRISEVRERYADIAAFSELGDYLEESIRTYSSGMLARLGFSVIAHVPASVMLIDEMLGVGDMRFKRKCQAFIRGFRERGGTLVIVSHDMGTLTELCDRGLFLRNGKVEANGPVQDVVEAYGEAMGARPSEIPGRGAA